MATLELRHLSFAWPSSPPLWTNVSLTLQPGDNVALIGANGSGKTTLFHCLTGLLPLTSGAILLDGETVQGESGFRRLRSVVGYCMQRAEDQLIFPDVLEDVCFGPLNQGLTREEAIARARDVLQRLGCSHLATGRTFHLSGGEQRLVALAGVMAMEPQILLLDEPLTGLDEEGVHRVTRLLAQLPCAKIITSHSEALLRQVCARTLTLEKCPVSP